MYCKYCGAVLPMGSRFCSNCSNEVEQQSWFQLSVWDVRGNTVIFQGYLEDEIWEAMGIYSME